MNVFRGYARGLTLIGAANAVVVGLGAVLLRVPLAAMLVPAFTAMAQQHNLTLAVTAVPGCPWQQDLYSVRVGDLGRNCPTVKDDLYARACPLHPDLIVDMNLGYEQPDQKVIVYVGPDGKRVPGGSPDEWIEKTTTDSLAAQLADAGKVLPIEPIPIGPTDPLSCLSQAKVVEECRFVANTQPTNLETLYRKLDTNSTRVWSLDMDKLVCPYLPICDPIVNNQVVKLDRTHLTREFAAILAPAINTYLQQNGIVPG